MNKLQKLYADFEEKNKRILKKASDEIAGQITDKTTPEQIGVIVNRVYNKYGIVKQQETLLMDAVIDSVSIGIGKTIAGKERVNSLKRWFVERAYSPDGSKFSSSINDLNRVDEIIAEIQQSIKVGKSWRTAAQDLMDKGIQRGDIAKDVQEVLDQARKAYGMTSDSEAYKAYRKHVETVQRRINGLVDPSTSKLKRAYQDILDLTNESSIKQIDNAAKYASYFKERYNAERIARTEMAGAYGDAFDTDNLQDEDSIGVRWVLSSGHPSPDICDFNAEADLYGMGPGGYPKDHYPPFPAHPSCLCSLEQIIERQEPANTKKDYNPKAAEKYLKSLSESKRKSLLGVTGSEEFENKPSSWSKQLKNFEPHKDRKAIIPKKVLYGK
jgi:hypothetical protein